MGEDPPDYQPSSPLRRMAELFEELSALDSKRAAVNGQLSQHFRAAATERQGKAAPPGKEEAALVLNG